jgi:hypothetical protein
MNLNESWGFFMDRCESDAAPIVKLIRNMWFGSVIMFTIRWLSIIICELSSEFAQRVEDSQKIFH